MENYKELLDQMLDQIQEYFEQAYDKTSKPNSFDLTISNAKEKYKKLKNGLLTQTLISNIEICQDDKVVFDTNLELFLETGFEPLGQITDLSKGYKEIYKGKVNDIIEEILYSISSIVLEY